MIIILFIILGFSLQIQEIDNYGREQIIKELKLKYAARSAGYNYEYYYPYEAAFGEMVPMPKLLQKSGLSYPINKRTFSIDFNKENDILKNAAERCIERAFYDDDVEDSQNFTNVLSLSVRVEDIETNLNYDVDQSYVLHITAGLSALYSNTIWGALYGLQTFSQLIHFNPTTKFFEIWEVSIADEPEYLYRGSLVDTSRHYISTDYIKKHLDAMESVKLNVLHWHIVDDPSFPYVSGKFPDLHGKGAFDNRTKIYTINDVKEIVSYANYRGINVIPEFDTPGHTDSWRGATGSFLDCGKNSGIIDPSLNSTYEFLQELFLEAKTLFGNNLIHIGGDEVDGRCWFNTPRVAKYAKDLNLTTSNLLQQHFTKRLLEKLYGNFSSILAWEEVFTDSKVVDPSIVVHVWKGSSREVATKAIAAGLRVIMSGEYYYDVSSSDWSWESVYSTNPRANFTEDKKKYIIGAEFCLWSEFISQSNFIQDSWVRGAVAAERFWSPYPSTFDFAQILPRFDEHQCRLERMKIFGIPLRKSFRCK